MNREFDLTIFADGGARGNPGNAAYGFVIFNHKKEEIVRCGAKIGIATNNIAEYTAVLEAFKWIEKHNMNETQKIAVYVDSQLVASQLSGYFKVKNEKLMGLHQKIKKIEHNLFANIEYNHIPREKNVIADSIVNQALDA
jgi:ribonuclease HI